MKSYLFAILLLLTMSGCKKDDEVQVNITGIIKNYYTQEIVNTEGLFVSEKIIDPTDSHLKHQDPYSGWEHTRIDIDSIGQFNQKIFLPNRNNKFYMVYYNKTYISDIYLIDLESNNNITITTKPYRELKISIRDTSRQFNSVSLFVKTENIIGDSFLLNGETDESILVKVVPEVEYYIKYTKENTELVYSYTDTTLYIDNVENLFYEILY